MQILDAALVLALIVIAAVVLVGIARRSGGTWWKRKAGSAKGPRSGRGWDGFSPDNRRSAKQFIFELLRMMKRKRGHWNALTDCTNAGVYCSVCHKKVWEEDYAECNRKNKLRSNYCPNCGARMSDDE